MITINDCLPLVKPHNGCDFHRVQLPFQQLGYTSTLSIDAKLEDRVKEAKIVTFNRDPGTDFKELENLRNKYHFKIVVDMDDYHVLHKDHQLYQIWQRNGYPQYLESIMRTSDAVTCTTERLADKLRTFNNNVYVIPNAVPFEAPNTQWNYDVVKEYGGKPYKQFSKSGAIKTIHRTRFAWSGGSSHLGDIKSIAPVFKEFPYLDFKLCGYDNPEGHRNNVWIDMEAITSLNSKNPNYKRAYTKPLDTYMTHLDNVDVAFAPLELIEWNGYKSSLKAYEAGIKKCALICSDIAPYTDDLPRDIVTFCETPEEWMDAIDDHLGLEYTKQQAEKLHKWVYQYRNLRIVSNYRLKVYDFIANNGIAKTFPAYDLIIKKQYEQVPASVLSL